MIQVDRDQEKSGVLDFVRLASAARQSSDYRKRGGDFVAYDLRAGFLTLLIGDASSKESEGRKMARLFRSSFRSCARTSSPGRILQVMSEALMERAGMSAPSPAFASALVAKIDLASGVLSYAAAGVEGGIVFGVRSPHVHLGATGPLIGIERYPLYEEHSMRFLPGDSLIAYTDGVTEAVAATDAAPFGSSGLVRTMRDIRPAGDLSIRALWKKIGKFTGHTYHDDATLAIVTTPDLRPTPFRLPRLPRISEPMPGHVLMMSA